MKKFLISFIFLLICIVGCNNSKQFDIEDFNCFNTNFGNNMKEVKKDCKNSGIKVSEVDKNPFREDEEADLSDNLSYLSGYGSFFDIDCKYVYTFEDDKLKVLNIRPNSEKYSDEDNEEIFYKLNDELKNIYGNPYYNILDDDDIKFVNWNNIDNDKVTLNILLFCKEGNWLEIYTYPNPNDNEDE